jgi:methionyl-tRNA formyltransferase
LKIIFIGTVEFSRQSLKKILEIGGNVVGVCTKRSSSFNADYADLIPICETHQVPYKLVENINDDETLEWIKQKSPDVIFCFGWSSLIKQELLKMPNIGVIGFHPSLLPKNRGRHPLIWALVLGLKETGSTFFMMNEGADTGDILSQTKIAIDEADDATSLYDKVTVEALKQIESFLPDLTSGNYKLKKQDNSQANVWRKRGISDGQIDFRMTSLAIYNLVRALTRPYCGAHINVKGDFVKVWKVSHNHCELDNIEPGYVINVIDNYITVKTFDGAVTLDDHEFTNLPRVGDYL